MSALPSISPAERIVNIIPAPGRFWAILKYSDRYVRSRVAAWAIVEDSDGMTARAMSADDGGYLTLVDSLRCAWVVAEDELDACESGRLHAEHIDDRNWCSKCGGMANE